jgi:hypothetical protein
MPKFTVVNGSIKQNKKVHPVDSVLELSVEDAERINKKGVCVELTDVHEAKKKAKADAAAAIAKAEKDATESLKKAEKKDGAK